MGTGKGYFTEVLAEEGFSVASIDLSIEDQQIARLNMEYGALTDRVEFYIMDAERMSFSDKQFDTVVSVNVVHHLQRPFCVLDEMIRVLQPFGKIVLADFTQEGFRLILGAHPG